MEKTRKLTREELVVVNAGLAKSNSEWSETDQIRRREFAKSFAWRKKSSYGYNNDDGDYITPTWPQIFVELGKLLGARDFRDFEGNISELECKVESILRKEDNKGQQDFKGGAHL